MKKITRLFCAVILCITTLPCFAIDAYVSELYKQIDTAFENKSESQLNSILSKNSEDPNYYLLENYSMKKIRRLVIAEDYQFALQANLVLIDNDIDNEDAVEMYSTIATALEKQKQQEALAIERQRIAQARFEAQKAKTKVSTDKDFQAQTTASGDAIYIKDKNEKFSYKYWQVRFGMASINIIGDSDANYMSTRYGLSLDGTFDYSFDRMLVGGDAGLDVAIFSFSDSDDKDIPLNFYITPKIGINHRNRGFFGRVGFGGIVTNKPSDVPGKDTPILMDSMYTPILGVGFDRVKLGPVALNANIDYYIGHLYTSGLNFALGSEINAGFTFSEMEKAKLTFNLGWKNTLLIKDSGPENRARIVLAIGAENVAK